MKLIQIAAVPALALAAGLGLAACGGQPASHAAPAATHSVAATPTKAPPVAVPATAPQSSAHKKHLAHLAQVVPVVTQAPVTVAPPVQQPVAPVTQAPAVPAPVTPTMAPPAPLPTSGRAPCTTIAGMYPGGLPGHINPADGFCVMDGGTEG